MVKTKEILIKKKNIPGYFPPFLAHAKSDFDTKMEKKKKKKKEKKKKKKKKLIEKFSFVNFFKRSKHNVQK